MSRKARVRTEGRWATAFRPPSETRTTMFYDGGCPLCRREVGHYRRLDTAGEVRWVDIDLDPEALSSHGLKPAAAMRRLHALDHEGRMVSGVYAFLAIWRRLPYYRHLARIVETLRLAPLLDLIYARFADWRFRRRCGSGACAIDP